GSAWHQQPSARAPQLKVSPQRGQRQATALSAPPVWSGVLAGSPSDRCGFARTSSIQPNPPAEG
ncbi:MAG TPA: hypothetical protein PLD41_16400, partial [Casimicrobium huifangae]|nr:hypothetical protein [Casimicrobium huifangae]